jgi:hypothetical protein
MGGKTLLAAAHMSDTSGVRIMESHLLLDVLCLLSCLNFPCPPSQFKIWENLNTRKAKKSYRKSNFFKLEARFASCFCKAENECSQTM